MRVQFRILAFAAVLTATLAAPIAAQTPAKPAPAVPRTPWGAPDLQGIWSNATITPLERPQNVTSLVLTDEQAERMERATLERRERLNQPSDPDRPAPPKGGDGSTGAAGNVGGYNNFWLDPGERVAVVDGQRRSSLIIDPPNGRIPPLTEQARARQKERLKMMAGRGQYDHPEFRPLAERCLLSFGPTTPLVLRFPSRAEPCTVTAGEHAIEIAQAPLARLSDAAGPGEREGAADAHDVDRQVLAIEDQHAGVQRVGSSGKRHAASPRGWLDSRRPDQGQRSATHNG